MGSYKYFRAVHVYILIVCGRCDAVGSFLVCIYPFLWETTSCLAIELLEKQRRLRSLFVEQICTCMKYVDGMYMEILNICSQFDAEGSFPACIDPFSWEITSFLIRRAAREITPTRTVICQPDPDMHARLHRNSLMTFTCGHINYLF